MGLLASITGFLTAWTETAKTLQKLDARVDQIFEWHKQNEERKYVQASHDAHKPLIEGNTTPNDKDKAARDIANLDRRL